MAEGEITRIVANAASATLPGMAETPSHTKADEWTGRLLLPWMRNDPEVARRGRLIIRFGFLGFVFGMIYATFYLIIDHYWGAAIIIICSLGFVVTPFLIRRVGSVNFAGNLLAALMTAGFTALCGVEGGMNGHAIAWLASVPLCALLLVGENAARCWVGICFFAAAVVIGVHLAGITLPFTYDPAWHSLVTAAGYLGLIAFMFLLGMIFERGRDRAFQKMTDALAKLAASNEKLVNLNHEKNEFMGIAAHDLKNPLTSIVANADFLRITADPAKTERLAGNIVGAATRMRDLIEDLLDANAIEEGRYSSRLENCELGSLLSKSVSNNLTNASRKGIAFEVSVPAGLFVRADQIRAIQIFDNLISNAIKFSQPGTEVKVRATARDVGVVVEVQDQGPGLSVADQKKLFRKFSRLSAQPTAGESSSGLGLAIVKRLTEAMGGSVYCQSVLGEGATFLVTLPQGMAPAQPVDGPVPSSASQGSG